MSSSLLNVRTPCTMTWNITPVLTAQPIKSILYSSKHACPAQIISLWSSTTPANTAHLKPTMIQSIRSVSSAVKTRRYSLQNSLSAFQSAMGSLTTINRPTNASAPTIDLSMMATTVSLATYLSTGTSFPILVNIAQPNSTSLQMLKNVLIARKAITYQEKPTNVKSRHLSAFSHPSSTPIPLNVSGAMKRKEKFLISLKPKLVSNALQTGLWLSIINALPARMALSTINKWKSASDVRKVQTISDSQGPADPFALVLHKPTTKNFNNVNAPRAMPIWTAKQRSVSNASSQDSGTTYQTNAEVVLAKTLIITKPSDSVIPALIGISLTLPGMSASLMRPSVNMTFSNIITTPSNNVYVLKISLTSLLPISVWVAELERMSFMSIGMKNKISASNATWECTTPLSKMHVWFVLQVKLSIASKECAKMLVLKNQDLTEKQKNVSALTKGIIGLEITVPIAPTTRNNIGWMNSIAVQNVHKTPTLISNSGNAPDALKDSRIIQPKNCAQRLL